MPRADSLTLLVRLILPDRLTFLLLYDKMSIMKKEYIECGCVRTAYGVRGLLKIESWCDTPKVLAGQKRVFIAEGEGKFKELSVLSASVMGDAVLMGFSGIESREDAFAYRGVTLYLHRSDIPVKRGAVLIADIIGLPVIDQNSGRVYGRVKDVTDSPASKLYVIETDSGEVLLPGVKEFVKKIDTESGVYITPIPGFFGDGDEI